jgi:hypothetical protein
VPVASVVAEQVWPASVKVSGTPTTPAAGEAEMLTSVAARASGPFGSPDPGLWFSVRNVLCLPGVQVTFASFEKSVVPPSSAVANALSVPVETPV